MEEGQIMGTYEMQEVIEEEEEEPDSPRQHEISNQQTQPARPIGPPTTEAQQQEPLPPETKLEKPKDIPVIIEQQIAGDAEEDEYGEYYEEDEEEEIETTRKDQHSGQAKLDEMSKLRQIVESQQKIPKIIIIKDEYGVEQEYEVLEESEEEKSIDLSVSRKEGQMSLRVVKRGPHSRETDQSFTDDEGRHHKRVERIFIEGNAEESVEYYEEVIEESEEESDAMDNEHLRNVAVGNLQ